MISTADIYKVLESVPDPEIPVITIADLGILRDVEVDQVSAKVTVYITPTYSGCPAMDMITVQIRAALEEAGIKDVQVISLLEPAWTTDWISEDGKRKLQEYGIAPPEQRTGDAAFKNGLEPIVTCPLCHSDNTLLVSRFGSTPCKSLYKCNECLEPFDYFKCH
jgi:ring-1,2-phenylacetyl-CoA epoxidase subunit PaaD